MTSPKKDDRAIALGGSGIELRSVAQDNKKNHGIESDKSDITISGRAATEMQNAYQRLQEIAKKDFFKSSKLKEFTRHVLFIIVFLAGVTLHRSVYESYLLNQALATAFVTQQIDFSLQPFPKTFTDIGQPDEFSDWFTSVLGGTLDQTTFYNGDNMTTSQENYVMFSNRLIGGVRVRQLRVAPNKGCEIPHQLREVSNGTCYTYSYSTSSRDTEPFGPPEDPERYKYQTPEETGSVGFFGYILDYLDGGGYVVDVNIEDRLAGHSYTDAFQQLIDDMFMDRQTRAIIISMIFLNTELESRVAVLYLIIEIPGNGEFNPNFMLKTFRLDMYVTPLDYFRMFLEIVFLILVLLEIYYEASELTKKIKQNKSVATGLKKYFYNGWNIIELLDIALYIAVIVLYVKYLVSPERYRSNLTNQVYSSDMERLAAIALNFYNILAFNVILTTFRTFKFLKLNHRLYVLWITLSHAGIDLLGFLFIFLIFIFGFIFMGWLSFGSDLVAFNTFVNAFATCWNFIIGNAPDYGSMYASNRVLGPTFFVLFTVFIFFILANMFIAILGNSFQTVNDTTKSEKRLRDILEEKMHEAWTSVQKFFNGVFRKNTKRRPITEILDNLQHPEIINRTESFSTLTRSDIAQAIGDGAIDTEVDGLHEYIQRTVRKSKHKSDGTKSPTTKEIPKEYKDDPKTAAKPLIKKSAEFLTPPSPRLHGGGGGGDKVTSALVGVQAQMADMQAQMAELRASNAELKQLIHRLLPTSNRNNNNNNNNND